MKSTGARILLCDDEPNLRKVLGALLQQEGFEVHAENDGEAALARVRASPSGTFDAVITDLRMPSRGRGGRGGGAAGGGGAGDPPDC